MEQVLAGLLGWLTDARITIILALIALDVVLGVAAALKHRRFMWRALGDFYVTNVLPKLVGYIALHVILGAVVGVGNFIGQGAQWIAFSTLAASLIASLAENFRDIYQTELPVIDQG